MIQLHTLKLDGWLSYNKVEIPLDKKGITWIRGKIGAGKSAILEAIFYLLFGKTLRKKTIVANLPNKILNNGYDISLDFSVDNARYFVQEIRERKKHGLYFTKNGVSFVGKTDPETRARIQAALGMSPDDFRAIAFLGQRQSQALVEGDEAERAKTLVDIFGLEKYTDIVEACSKDVKKNIDEKKELTTTLAQYEQDFESLEKSLIIEDEPDEVVPTAADIKHIDAKIEKVENKISFIQKKTEEVNKVIGKVLALSRQREQVQKIEEQIRTIKKDLQKRDAPTKELETLEEELQVANKNYILAKQRLEDTEAQIEKATKLKNVCPIINDTCPADVPIKHQKKILQACQKEQLGVEKNVTKLGCTVRELTKERNNTEAYEENRAELSSKRSILKSLALLEDVPSAEEQNEKLRKYRDLIIVRKDRLEKLRSKKEEMLSKITIAQQREELRERVNNALEEKEQRIQKLKKQIRNKSIEVQYLSGALAVFKKMKMYKIDLVLQLLNTHLKTILDRISDGEYKAEFTSQKQTADKKKTLDKINIVVYDSYKMLPIELCSGGQSTEVGLAVLLSVWKTANAISQKSVSSLWLDEVFGPLDTDIINRVFDSVIDIIKEMGATSVKIISHQDLDSRLFDDFWYAYRKNGISKIKFN